MALIQCPGCRAKLQVEVPPEDRAARAARMVQGTAMEEGSVRYALRSLLEREEKEPAQDLARRYLDASPDADWAATLAGLEDLWFAERVMEHLKWKPWTLNDLLAPVHMGELIPMIQSRVPHVMTPGDFRRVMGLTDDAAFAAFEKEWAAYEAALVQQVYDPKWPDALKAFLESLEK
jgi:hypothetical protein